MQCTSRHAPVPVHLPKVTTTHQSTGGQYFYISQHIHSSVKAPAPDHPSVIGEMKNEAERAFSGLTDPSGARTGKWTECKDTDRTVAVLVQVTALPDRRRESVRKESLKNSMPAPLRAWTLTNGSYGINRQNFIGDPIRHRKNRDSLAPPPLSRWGANFFPVERLRGGNAPSGRACRPADCHRLPKKRGFTPAAP